MTPKSAEMGQTGFLVSKSLLLDLVIPPKRISFLLSKLIFTEESVLRTPFCLNLQAINLGHKIRQFPSPATEFMI